jgi:hypothetical protein
MLFRINQSPMTWLSVDSSFIVLFPVVKLQRKCLESVLFSFSYNVNHIPLYHHDYKSDQDQLAVSTRPSYWSREMIRY